MDAWGRSNGPTPVNQFFILFIMKLFFQVISFIYQFDLGSIFKSIAFPFVFVFVCYEMLIDYFSQCNFILPEFYSPKPIQSPLFLINEDLQKLTVKNLRGLRKFPRNYKKQDMINALLITN